jgi:hypothetical protein
MDIRQQVVTEYLTQGIDFRDPDSYREAKKYGVSRSSICKWAQIHQGIHNIAPTEKQEKYYLNTIKNTNQHSPEKLKALEQKIALLEKASDIRKIKSQCTRYHDYYC